MAHLPSKTDPVTNSSSRSWADSRLSWGRGEQDLLEIEDFLEDPLEQVADTIDDFREQADDCRDLLKICWCSGAGG